MDSFFGYGMQVIDLFAGMGGFTVAAHACNFDTIQFVENNAFAIKYLQKAFPNIPIHAEIETYIPEPYAADIICGGFPCQPFSKVGHHKGTADERYLWGEMLRVIQLAKPTWVIVENVRALLANRFKLAFEQLCVDLETKNYELQTFVLPAASKGYPHLRERIFVLAYSDSIRKQRRLLPTRSRTLANESAGLLTPSFCEWSEIELPKPIICGKNDGLYKPTNRPMLKLLGNAIVPNVAIEIFKAISYAEQHV